MSSLPIPPYWELTYMASPAQTVTGKGKSNLLIAGGLLKIPRDSNYQYLLLVLLIQKSICHQMTLTDSHPQNGGPTDSCHVKTKPLTSITLLPKFYPIAIRLTLWQPLHIHSANFQTCCLYPISNMFSSDHYKFKCNWRDFDIRSSSSSIYQTLVPRLYGINLF